MKASFQDIVELYRLCGKPEINGGVFLFDGSINDELSFAVRQLEDNGSDFAEILDSVDYSDPFRFEVSVSCNSKVQFCESFSDLIGNARTLSKGVPLECVYVKDVDWSSSDNDRCHKYENLVNACTLTRTLCELSDSADTESNPHFNLLYLSLPQKKEGVPDSFQLKTIIVPDVVDLKLKHVRIVEAIKDQVDLGAPNAEERAQILLGAISEVLGEVDAETPPHKFFYCLLCEWDLVLKKYRHNLQIYLKKFSFEKLRQELGQATVEHGQKVGAAFGDIASKLLALPLSVVLLEKVYSSDSHVSKVLFFAGLCLVSIVMASMVQNQKLIFLRLRSAQGLLFTGVQSGKGFFSKEIREFMADSREQAETQERYLESVIRIFQWLAWVPILSGCYFVFLAEKVDAELVVSCLLKFLSSIGDFLLSPYLSNFCATCILP